MQSSVLTKTEVSPMESKSSKITELPQSESVASWTWKHPNIQNSFFENLIPPSDVEEAHLYMCCHQHNEQDFDLQLKTMELELDEYLDADDRPVEDLIADTRSNQIRYLKSKRYHHNARCCYWYWMQRESDANHKKAKRKKKVQK